MNFSGNKDGPGPPKLQLVAFGKLNRSRSIKLTSARLRQGFFLCGETRAAGTAPEDTVSYAPRSDTNVPRPISPRVHPFSAKDSKALVTVVKLTPRSDASARTVAVGRSVSADLSGWLDTRHLQFARIGVLRPSTSSS